jgi:type I restriction enzyme S subunit
MKSSYKILGSFIEPVNQLNDGMEVKELLGISNQKFFQNSHTNTIGIDLQTYRIVRTNQFAYNRATTRNGDKISIALRQGNDCIVSPSYRVFKSKNENLLNSEYLMMWFCRPEFDRYARFKSHGSAHEFFEYDQMCQVELPIPGIAKQREIVNEYNIIQNRITLNQQLIQKLEVAAQATYKQWFVDFEFPNKNGGNYKSHGGEMDWNQESQKEYPFGWKIGKLTDISTIIMGQSPEGETYNKNGNGMIFYQGRTDFGYRFPEIRTYTTHPKKKALKNDILISVRAPVGDLNIAIENCSIGRGVGALRSKFNCNSHLFYLLQNLKSYFEISDGEGTIFGSINKDDLHNIVVIYSENEIKNFEKIISPIDSLIKNYCIENQKLVEMKNLLLSKLATIEN